MLCTQPPAERPEACSNDLRPRCFRDSYESDGLSRKTYPNLRTTIEGRVCSTLPPPLGWSFMTLGKICPQLAFRATPNQTRRPLCPSSTTRLQPPALPRPRHTSYFPTFELGVRGRDVPLRCPGDRSRAKEDRPQPVPQHHVAPPPAACDSGSTSFWLGVVSGPL